MRDAFVRAASFLLDTERVERFSSKTSALLGIAAVLSCVPAPRGPIDLQQADTRVVHFGLGPRSTVCPGEPVSLDVALDATVDGSELRLVRYRQAIDDYIFDIRQLHLSSPQGTFDREGTFYPNPDVMASVQTGFVMYARAPRGPAFSVRFPPSYECTNRIGRSGERGIAGSDGRDAAISDRNEGGPHGTTQEPPATGQAGQAGGAGSAGPHFAVYVTWVTTPDYTKLLAARAAGDVDRITLVAPGTPLEVVARGGEGGAGGRGGKGATSTDLASYGGVGGAGGDGGPGGPGGAVEVFVDERFGDIEGMLTVDVRGGPGGRGGHGGSGGEGFSSEKRGTSAPVQSPPGQNGVQGRGGPSGRFNIRHASTETVRSGFENALAAGAIVML